MRIRIVLDLNNKCIPVNYRNMLVGVCYNFFPRDEMTTMLHDDGMRLGNKKYKLFTFSEIYGETTYLKDTKQLKFNSNACFDITAFDDNLILNVINFLDNNDGVIFGNQIISIVKYDILEETKLNFDEVTYYTVSPITVYRTIDKFTKFYTPSDEDFKDLIISNLQSKYYLCYKSNMPNVSINSITNIKKKIVRFRNAIYESYHLNISFSGINKEIHNVIMSCGLGPKNAIGFGMVSLKHEKKNLSV